METTKPIKIFIVEDDPVISNLFATELGNSGNFEISVFRNGNDFLNQLHHNPDIVSLDYYLPDYTGIELLERIKIFNKNIYVIFVSSQDKVDIVVDAYKRGVTNYIVKNRNTVVEYVNSVKNLSNSIVLKNEVDVLKEKVIDRNKYKNIIGESYSILKVLRLIEKVEKTSFLTLITGETGTGKDMVARAIHYNSPRFKKPFVPVNITAIPEDLIESELFGHEKGAFTGAISQRIGKFEEANGGTIFLDEIGDMNFNLQTKLLRVLQEGKVTRLGSNKEIKLDVRILAATNKNLGQKVREGSFRDDLFYRLQGFLIHLPPLRDRQNDVILLAKHFVKDICELNKIQLKQLTGNALQSLLDHNWPGNIRELRSVIERAVIISENGNICAEDLIYSTTV